MKFTCLALEKQCPVLGLKKPEGSSDHAIVFKVERDACNLLGPWNRKEYDSFMAICKHGSHINRCFEEMKVAYKARAVPPPPVRRVRGVGNVGSEFPAKGKGKGKAKAGGSKVGLTKALESEATLKPLASSSASLRPRRLLSPELRRRKGRPGTRVPISPAPMAPIWFLS